MAGVPPIIPPNIAELSTWLTSWTVAGSVTGWKSAIEPLAKIVEIFWEVFGKVFDAKDETAWRRMLTPFREAGLLRPEDIESLVKLRLSPAPLNFVLFITTFFSLWTNQSQALIAPSVEKLSQAGYKMFRPALPSAESAIQAAFIAPEKAGQVREYLAKLGFPDDVIDILFLSRYKLYDENAVMILWWRKILSDERAFERMRELGYTDTRTKELMQAWTLIPPVQDILTMVAHEAFEPDSIRKMGLDEEFPEEQSEFLAKQGLSPYWQMKYWISHWEQPSIGMGYEMLQRGIIKREDLEFLFRTVEIPRFWREKLLAIAYTPYTRVDSRRMHKLGVLNDAELVKAYTDIGYDAEHAQKMAEFTKKANLAAEKDLTKGEILSGYSSRLIPKSDAQKFLISLGYDANETDYILGLEDYKEKQIIQKNLISVVEQQFKNGIFSKSQAQTELDKMNLPSDQVQSLIAKWDAGMVTDYKLPSKTDLDKFLAYKIISLDTYRLEMKRLGYSAIYTSWYEKLTLLKGPTQGSE